MTLFNNITNIHVFPSQNGQTPLHMAAAPKYPYSKDALMYLIKNGADLSAVDKVTSYNIRK